MLTKQQKDPYIWDKYIKIKTKEGKYEQEEEDKPKVLVKEVKNGRIIKKDLQDCK